MANYNRENERMSKVVKIASYNRLNQEELPETDMLFFLQMHLKKIMFICLMMSLKNNGRKKCFSSDLICLCIHLSQNQQISHTYFHTKQVIVIC